MSITTIIPVPSDKVAASKGATRLPSVKGSTVGIMFNIKQNGSELLSAIGDLLREQHDAKAVLPPVKTAGIYLPTEEQLKDVADKADMVLVGLGDCGSCSACSVQVAAEFERAGVPAVAICTTPFLKSGQAMAARQGLPNLRFVTIEHPLSSLTIDELRERAKEAVSQVVSIVCADDELNKSEAAALADSWAA
ncbi:UGSC family (seleno)protein [Chelatococcus reniformis]|uniref:UGSC-like domain-containing protein n=1 Tax=Chelatococcus reniformis TaxID=1494448 RepID=A0A916TYE3_9HYPH|nr:UGSC family (seleno)protein [Chelatococcus reniformis]GGC48674.1 hypothetical protein GCM10010994_04830 [Chelatococcus reniformis]